MNKQQTEVSDGIAKDLILEYSISEKSNPFTLEHLKNNLFPNKTLDEIKVLVQEIHESDQKTISLKIGRHEVYLLSNGSAKSFLKNGGFTKIEFTKNRNEQKEIFDFKVSKFKYHTFWWFFVFALIGFGLSIYNFTNNSTPSKNIIEQEERIENMESKLEKSQTSISNQKNRDSLHNPKVLTMKKGT